MVSLLFISVSNFISSGSIYRQTYIAPQIPWVIYWNIASQPESPRNGGPMSPTSIRVVMGRSPPVASTYHPHGFSKEERYGRSMWIEVAGLKYL
jgi:hypothetical protein